MSNAISLSSLIPAGLSVEQFEACEGALIVTASARNRQAVCPSCSSRASRVHSRYIRGVTDLPAAGRVVRLRLVTRRFRCDVGTCRRKIFAERFGDTVPERARRTGRMECIVHYLGLALGGRPAASFAERLMMPVSNDTLLRVVRRRAQQRDDPLRAVGIDDFAFRRNHCYGSIICDLERRQIVKILPDREIATVAAWLADHPEIRIVSRDRGGGYGEAAALALPEVVQVADRWHLMENASAAFLATVRNSMKPIRAALGATTIDPKLLTSAERIQYEGYLRREEMNGWSQASRRAASRSRRSFGKRVGAGNWFARLSAASAPIYSARDRDRSTRTFLISTPSGKQAAGTAPNSGVVFAAKGSGVRCGLLVSGPRDADDQSKSQDLSFEGPRPREPLPV